MHTLDNRLAIFDLFRYKENVVQISIVKLNNGLKRLLEKNFQVVPMTMHSKMEFSCASKFHALLLNGSEEILCF